MESSARYLWCYHPNWIATVGNSVEIWVLVEPKIEGFFENPPKFIHFFIGFGTMKFLETIHFGVA